LAFFEANGKVKLHKSDLAARREGEEDKAYASRVDYLKTLHSLQVRQPELGFALLRTFKNTPSIKVASGQLNLAYERNEPEAVKVNIFQKLKLQHHEKYF
jgi:hypothetical protein